MVEPIGPIITIDDKTRELRFRARLVRKDRTSRVTTVIVRPTAQMPDLIEQVSAKLKTANRIRMVVYFERQTRQNQENNISLGSVAIAENIIAPAGTSCDLQLEMF